MNNNIEKDNSVFHEQLNLKSLQDLLYSNPEILNERDENSGWTLLFNNVINNNFENVEYLLKSGADPNIPNIYDESPLYQAVELASHKLINLLLEHGANPNLQQQDGESALHLASLKGDIKIVKLLFLFKPDPTLKTYEAQKTALDYASEKGFTKIAEFLYQKMDQMGYFELENQNHNQGFEGNDHNQLIANSNNVLISSENKTNSVLAGSFYKNKMNSSKPPVFRQNVSSNSNSKDVTNITNNTNLTNNQHVSEDSLNKGNKSIDKDLNKSYVGHQALNISTVGNEPLNNLNRSYINEDKKKDNNFMQQMNHFEERLNKLKKDLANHGSVTDTKTTGIKVSDTPLGSLCIQNNNSYIHTDNLSRIKDSKINDMSEMKSVNRMRSSNNIMNMNNDIMNFNIKDDLETSNYNPINNSMIIKNSSNNLKNVTKNNNLISVEMNNMYSPIKYESDKVNYQDKENLMNTYSEISRTESNLTNNLNMNIKSPNDFKRQESDNLIKSENDRNRIVYNNQNSYMKNQYKSKNEGNELNTNYQPDNRMIVNKSYDVNVNNNMMKTNNNISNNTNNNMNRNVKRDEKERINVNNSFVNNHNNLEDFNENIKYNPNNTYVDMNYDNNYQYGFNSNSNQNIKMPRYNQNNIDNKGNYMNKNYPSYNNNKMSDNNDYNNQFNNDRRNSNYNNNYSNNQFIPNTNEDSNYYNNINNSHIQSNQKSSVRNKNNLGNNESINMNNDFNNYINYQENPNLTSYNSQQNINNMNNTNNSYFNNINQQHNRNQSRQNQNNKYNQNFKREDDTIGVEVSRITIKNNNTLQDSTLDYNFPLQQTGPFSKYTQDKFDTDNLNLNTQNRNFSNNNFQQNTLSSYGNFNNNQNLGSNYNNNNYQNPNISNSTINSTNNKNSIIITFISNPWLKRKKSFTLMNVKYSEPFRNSTDEDLATFCSEKNDINLYSKDPRIVKKPDVYDDEIQEEENTYNNNFYQTTKSIKEEMTMKNAEYQDNIITQGTYHKKNTNKNENINFNNNNDININKNLNIKTSKYDQINSKNNDNNNQQQINDEVDIEDYIKDPNTKQVYEFLCSITLSKYIKNFINNGFDDLNLMIDQMGKNSNEPFHDNNLKLIGINLPGHRARILVKLEELAKNFDFEIPVGLYYNLQPEFVSSTEALYDPHVKYIENWLSQLKMNSFLPNFLKAGYYCLELMLVQMVSKNPITDEILEKEVFIEKLGYRTRLLNKLKQGKITLNSDSKIYVDKLIDSKLKISDNKGNSNDSGIDFSCRCSIF
jgi:hypothetical protein